MNYLLVGISAAVGGFLAEFFGFRFLFLVMLALSILGLIVSTLLFSKKET